MGKHMGNKDTNNNPPILSYIYNNRFCHNNHNDVGNVHNNYDYVRES